MLFITANCELMVLLFITNRANKKKLIAYQRLYSL